MIDENEYIFKDILPQCRIGASTVKELSVEGKQKVTS